MKLFISYARVDKPLCKQIVRYLDDVHEVWYDTRLHAGQDWWGEIQERLNWCDGFVYLLSPESVASEYCQKEHAIAVKLGRHIFPVLIQAHTPIPDSLSHIHYANLSEGMEDIVTLINALTVAERRQHKQQISDLRLSVKPDIEPKTTSPNEALTQAADAMEVENFDNAVFIIKQALENRPTGAVARLLQALLEDAETALEKQTSLREATREYAPIRELVKRPATRAIGCNEFAEFRKAFPDYDPDNVAEICAAIPPLPQETVPEADEGSFAAPTQEDPLPLPDWLLDILEVQPTQDSPPLPAPKVRSGESPGVRAKSTSDLAAAIRAIIGDPFDLCDVPAGDFLYGEYKQKLTLPAFAIAKYPITYAQFQSFIDAEDGFGDGRWWEGLAERSNQPDDQGWKIADHPRENVSWYDSIAFCRWLSHHLGGGYAIDRVGEWAVRLPTEFEWEKAARGTDGREYPWGNEFAKGRCNSVESGIGQTTPVSQYPGGASPYGLLDMSGNVWEWCLTDYNKSQIGATKENMRSNSDRVVRGGSFNSFQHDSRAASRSYNLPVFRYLSSGFRVVCRPPSL